MSAPSGNPTSPLGDRWFSGTSVQNPSIPSSLLPWGGVYPSPYPSPWTFAVTPGDGQPFDAPERFQERSKNHSFF